MCGLHVRNCSQSVMLQVDHITLPKAMSLTPSTNAELEDEIVVASNDLKAACNAASGIQVSAMCPVQVRSITGIWRINGS